MPKTESHPSSGASAASFLEPHHREVARRVERLFERAHLRPRVTMRYAPITANARNTGTAGDISDMAAEARKALADIHRLLPGDCAAVVMDVCCYGKGLQTVETERGWPRRSAKLVLRIGLEHLAAQYGLSAQASGPLAQEMLAWADDGARPTEFG